MTQPDDRHRRVTTTETPATVAWSPGRLAARPPPRTPPQFAPLRAFGCEQALASGREYRGTLFRFALRTEAQAAASKVREEERRIDEVVRIAPPLSLTHPPNQPTNPHDELLRVTTTVTKT